MRAKPRTAFYREGKKRLCIVQGRDLGRRLAACSLLPRVIVRNLRLRPGLAPQDDLVAPRVFEGVVEAVEFLPRVLGALSK